MAESDPAFLQNRVLQAAVLNDWGEALLRANDLKAAQPVFARAAAICAQVLGMAPRWVYVLRESARAHSGIARALRDPELLRRSDSEWKEFHAQSPLDRTMGEERQTAFLTGR
jgi:hypothetical protein